MLRSRRDQGGGRRRERRPRFASSSGPCAARPWSSRSSARARIRLTARPEYVMPPFSSGHLRLAASRFEIHAVRDPVRAAFLFVGSSLFVRQCRMPKLCLLRAHSGAFRPADVVTHVLNGSHLRTGSAGLLDGSRAVIEGSGRLETLRYKCSAGNEIMHLNHASSITSRWGHHRTCRN